MNPEAVAAQLERDPYLPLCLRQSDRIVSLRHIVSIEQIEPAESQ